MYGAFCRLVNEADEEMLEFRSLLGFFLSACWWRSIILRNFLGDIYNIGYKLQTRHLLECKIVKVYKLLK